MSWKHIFGQDRPKRLLHAAWRSNRVPGAYLLYGMEGIGKDALAMEFARLVNCEHPTDDGACGECSACHRIASMQHPNVKFICALPLGKNEDARKDDPIAKLDADTLEAVREELELKWRDPYHVISIPRANEIKMSSVRDIKKELSLSTGGGTRVVIISRAEMMSDESQNALLKTLEEPPKNCVFVLTTSNRDRLQSTVRSRCQPLRCDSLPEEMIVDALIERDQIPAETAAVCAELGGGSFGLARKYADEEFATARKKAVDFLRTIAVNNVQALYSQLDELSHVRDKAVVEQFLLILLYWFRDAEVLRLGGRVNAHLAEGSEALQRFVGHYPAARYDEAVRLVELTASDVRRNANVFLAMRVLSSSLKTALG